jgi:hypothetical protein
MGCAIMAGSGWLREEEGLARLLTPRSIPLQQGTEHDRKSRVAPSRRGRERCAPESTSRKYIEATMAMQRQRQIVETPTEARQAEPGPSVLALLAISTGLAVLILGVVWFVFFPT